MSLNNVVGEDYLLIRKTKYTDNKITKMYVYYYFITTCKVVLYISDIYVMNLQN